MNKNFFEKKAKSIFYRIFFINLVSAFITIGLLQKLFKSQKIFVLRLFKMATNQTMCSNSNRALGV